MSYKIDKIAEKYHNKFGKEKSLYLTIGKTKDQPKFSQGQMQIQPTDEYKYLGETVMENQIWKTRWNK